MAGPKRTRATLEASDAQPQPGDSNTPTGRRVIDISTPPPNRMLAPSAPSAVPNGENNAPSSQRRLARRATVSGNPRPSNSGILANITDTVPATSPRQANATPRRAPATPSTPGTPATPTSVHPAAARYLRGGHQPTTPSPRPAGRTPTRRQALQPTPSPSPGPSRQTLTRSASLFTSTGRANHGSASDMASPVMVGPSLGSSGGAGGTAVLTRAASMSAVPSMTSLKETASGGSAPPPPVKGGGGNEGLGGPSGRRFGKGKENIPPARDTENAATPGPGAAGQGSSSRPRTRARTASTNRRAQDDTQQDREGREDEDGAEAHSSVSSQHSRKRVRVDSRATTGSSSRTRSCSVVSVRSETPSMPSGSFTDLSSWRSVSRTSSSLPSPSPSPSVTTVASYESSSYGATPEPVEVLVDDAMDVDLTPTKKGKQPIRGSLKQVQPPASLPALTIDQITPPPTSPVGTGLVVEFDNISVGSGSTQTEPTATNPYRSLKAALRLSATPGTLESIVGRADEKSVLHSYLSLVSSADVGMYISGPPGTGKTALTTAIGRELVGKGWRVAEVSMMGLSSAELWVRLGAELGCGDSESDVVEYLTTAPSTFIILDELDSLLPPPPTTAPPAVSHVLSKLFALPLLSGPGRSIKLVGISNTLDLTVRANLVLPEGSMPQVLPFKAYGSNEMTIILSNRLRVIESADSAKIDSKAVELLCRKVEAQNGDLRMCLGVLSAAVGLAEADWIKKSAAAATQESNPRPLIKTSLPHVLKAFTSHTSQLRAAAGSSSTGGTTTPTGAKIRSVPLHGRMVLVSLLVFLMRTRAGLSPSPTGSPNDVLTASSLYAAYAHFLSHEASPFPAAPESDYRDLLSNLETLGLVALVAPVRRGPTGAAARAVGSGVNPRVELCVRESEVCEGLGISNTPDEAKRDTSKLGMAEQEVLRLWTREQTKVGRALERARVAVQRVKDGVAVET